MLVAAPQACGHHCRRDAGPARSRRLALRRSRNAFRAVASTGVDAVVVGAGIAGLSAATKLHKQGLRVALVEASDGVGGRVRTDVHEEGFLLDRGFQIFLEGYPNARATLDYAALDLKPFYAGAVVRHQGKFHRVADPLRHPLDGILSLTNPVGTVADKVRVGLLRARTLLGSWDDLLHGPETTIAGRLKAEGFTPSITNLFFRPFLGGIFFNRDLTTSSRLFLFVMRTLASGANSLPAGGIGAMTQQLAAQLPGGCVRLNTRAARVAGATAGAPAQVVLESGEVLEAARGVVVAVEGPEAGRLLGDALEVFPSKRQAGVGSCCLYFAAPRDPRGEGVLYLNGDDAGIVNNCCFPSSVAPSYAPPGQALVSASVIGTQDDLTDQQLEEAVRSQLGDWFGSQEVASWRLLRTYRIPFAQPCQVPPTNLRRPVALGDGLFVCGDHRDAATFDAAIVSGHRAADALLATAAAQPAPLVAAAQA